MYDQEEQTTEPTMPDRPERRELGIVGSSLNSAKEQAPMANAYMQQEKAIAGLEMTIEGLERRLDPISTRYDEPQNKLAEDPSPPTSEIVRAIQQNTHKIIRLSEKVKRMTNELEV